MCQSHFFKRLQASALTPLPLAILTCGFNETNLNNETTSLRKLELYHIVIYWVRFKIFSGKWGLKMNR